MAVEVVRADYANPVDAEALRSLLNAYACDPMGGGEALCDDVMEEIVPGLAAQSNAVSFIAWLDGVPVGLANCFFGYSTFVARPLLNIHDVIVLREHRGHGIATALFAAIEAAANEANACKVTLEVLSGNEPAKSLYSGLGYGAYALDPQQGAALFWQKRLAA
jgi:ribosomal protein S18 acetylase RimI-like enzyme